jgi:hypothetical protein
MTGFDAHADLTAEFAFLRGVLDSSGPWARAVLAGAACESPWFVTQVADLAPAPSPSPLIGLAAGLAVSMPLAGPLSAQAGEFTETVRHVLGHQTQDGALFDFGNGEAVWADDGKAVTRSQLRALNRGDRGEFYASMGLADPAPADAETLTIATAPASEARIRVVRDEGREAPVLAEVRQKVAMLRAQRRAEYLAFSGAPVAHDAAPAPAPEGEAGLAPAAKAQPATLYDVIWAQVAAERQVAKESGVAPQETALAPAPGKAPSLYQAIWAEVQAERAAARGDGILGTMASQPAPPQEAAGDSAGAIAGPAANPPSPAALPDLVDIPRAGDVADIPAVPEMADVSPQRDLIDASAAILDRS